MKSYSKKVTIEEGTRVLRRARRILARRKAWTQHKFFGMRDERGACVETSVAKANCFCLLGALERAVLEEQGRSRSAGRSRLFNAVKTFLQSYSYNTRGVSPINFNDTPGRTQTEVVDFLDAAVDASLKPKHWPVNVVAS